MHRTSPLLEGWPDLHLIQGGTRPNRSLLDWPPLGAYGHHVPIDSVTLGNFKCFADSGQVELAPLTVIFGRNNVGKSSILQSLLLLRQTLDAPEYGPRLNLSGRLYAAGAFADVVHGHRASSHLTMSFGVRGKRVPEGTVITFEFTSDEPQPPRLVSLEIKSPNVPDLVIARGRGKGGPYTLSIGPANIGVERQADFRFPVDGFLPLIGDEPSRVGRPSPQRERARKRAREVLAVLESAIRGTRAIGAFRRQPERRYEYMGRTPASIGLAGEHVVAALIEDSTRRGAKGEMLRSVNQWLNHTGHVRLLPIRRLSRGARLFELRLKDVGSGQWGNFADVGFGIGQALPVFVEGLRTPPGELFIVQEPEIHLHPDAQLAMADFLVSLVKSGRRVIVETHSENLLLRFRHAVLGGTARQQRRPRLRPDELSVIYVHKANNGLSTTRRIEVDELGQTRNWPVDFMQEATKERMAILEAQSKLVPRR